MIGVLAMYTPIWQIIKNQQKSWIECIGINPGNSKLEKSESMCDPYPAKTFSGQKGGTYKHAKKHEETWQIIKTYQTSLRILKSDGKNIMIIMPLDLDLHIKPSHLQVMTPENIDPVLGRFNTATTKRCIVARAFPYSVRVIDAYLYTVIDA